VRTIQRASWVWRTLYKPVS